MNALVLAKLLALPELEAHLAQVEATLAGALELDNDAIVVPARLVVLGGGKRLRPALTIAVSEKRRQQAVGIKEPPHTEEVP